MSDKAAAARVEALGLKLSPIILPLIRDERPEDAGKALADVLATLLGFYAGKDPKDWANLLRLTGAYFEACADRIEETPREEFEMRP